MLKTAKSKEFNGQECEHRILMCDRATWSINGQEEQKREEEGN